MTGPSDVSDLVEATQLSKALAAVARCTDADDLETRLATNLRDVEWLDGQRAQIVTAIQQRFRAITGTPLAVATARSWLTAPPGAAGWAHVTTEGRILGTEENVEELLRSMGATVRYDTMRKADEILLADRGFTMDNRDNASLGAVLSAANAVDMKIQVATLKTYINMIAERNQYNPPLAWITSAPWDGVDRKVAWYATVGSPNELVRDMVMGCWALQCVAILHNTGKMMARGVLTFQGLQYMGKSRWLQSLAPEGMVRAGLMLDAHNKDHVKQAISYWITELGEVDGSFRRSDLAALKAFISNVDDELRLPYAVAASKFPRRTSLAATVNQLEFLRDPSGNSRYWTVEAISINPDHGIDMQQFWAQILVEWQAGALPWLTPAEMDILNASNEDFTPTDPLEELLLTKLPWGSPETTWIWRTVTDVAETIGALQDRGAVVRLGALIRKHNGGRHTRLHGGVRVLWVPAARRQAEDFGDE